jgi:hypothetical protein
MANKEMASMKFEPGHITPLLPLLCLFDHP